MSDDPAEAAHAAYLRAMDADENLPPDDASDKRCMRHALAAWCEAQSKLPQNQYHHNVVADWLREQATALRGDSAS